MTGFIEWWTPKPALTLAPQKYYFSKKAGDVETQSMHEPAPFFPTLARGIKFWRAK